MAASWLLKHHMFKDYLFFSHCWDTSSLSPFYPVWELGPHLPIFLRRSRRNGLINEMGKTFEISQLFYFYVHLDQKPKSFLNFSGYLKRIYTANSLSPYVSFLTKTKHVAKSVPCFFKHHKLFTKLHVVLSSGRDQ